MTDKKLAIMQPYLFPYIGYFQLINAVDLYVFFDDVQWIERGWINRSMINFNEKETKIVLSTRKHSSRSILNEVELLEEGKKDYLNKIALAYSKAPFFPKIFEFISSIMEYETTNAAKFVENSIIKTARLLDINTEFKSSTDISNNKSYKGQDKVIDIVKTLGFNIYVNNVNGQHLYDKQVFKDNNLTLYFFEKEISEYKQFKEPFIPFLSIIDVLMFNDLEVVKEMLKKGRLV